MGKVIIITGGAGFIGYHLCTKLLDDGNTVICIDNLKTAVPGGLKNLVKYQKFKFIEHDIREPIDIKADEIYNLACPASPKHYQAKPIDTILTSVVGAYNLLELATKKNIKILQASTSEIYGNPLKHPQREEHWGYVNPIGIRSCYNEGKRSAESLFIDFNREYNTGVRIARIFNTYGPYMNVNDGRLISNIVMQALMETPITIYGDGKQTRSFCYIDDMVTGLIKLMASDITDPVNVGSPNEHDINTVAEMVVGITGTKSGIVYKDLPNDDPVRRRPDITRAKHYLKWEPEVSLRGGLIKTIEYFKGQVTNG